MTKASEEMWSAEGLEGFTQVLNLLSKTKVIEESFEGGEALELMSKLESGGSLSSRRGVFETFYHMLCGIFHQQKRKLFDYRLYQLAIDWCGKDFEVFDRCVIYSNVVNSLLLDHKNQLKNIEVIARLTAGYGKFDPPQELRVAFCKDITLRLFLCLVYYDPLERPVDYDSWMASDALEALIISINSFARLRR